jgi:hypothetical protein
VLELGAYLFSKLLQVGLRGRFVAVLHRGTPFVLYARKERRGWCRRWDLFFGRALSQRKLLILLHAQCA